MQFIGRKKEIARLRATCRKNVASFIVIKGRRRIGKSRLIEEFSKDFDQFYHFVGMAPEHKITAQAQLDEFSRQLAENTHSAKATYENWGDAFWALGDRVQSGKILILLDEISWMGSEDPTFLPKIKNLWDLYLKKNTQLVFIICGSASSWIEKNILSTTGFVGRISLTLTLEELSLEECSERWPPLISAYEKFKLLSITGGVPRYLEDIDPNKSAEENIRELCFSPGGFLVDEFERIFSNTFLHNSHRYKEILHLLANGAKEKKEIEEKLGILSQGRTAEYLWELELAGFITRDYRWNIKTGKESKLSQFRLHDNYVRFYLYYIEQNLGKIQKDHFESFSLATLPEWRTIMALQFENMVLHNRRYIQERLHIKPEDIIGDGPYFQRKTARAAGCQIDYLIQTRFSNLYLCEIKCSKNKIDTSVIHEMKNKISSLQTGKHHSRRPVLIHMNGVTDEVLESRYFAEIIDMSDALANQE